MRRLLDVDNLMATELAEVLDLVLDGHPPAVLAGKGGAPVLEKSSARHRNSSEMAVQLGGDVWMSMGQEAEAMERLDAFQPYEVGAAPMSPAAPGVVFLRCLPARRGQEVTAEVTEGPASLVGRRLPTSCRQ
jgi:ornithine carbamoyltransferase